MKSSPSIWHLLHNVKSKVKISSIFVAFLENTNFIADYNNKKPHYKMEHTVQYIPFSSG